jgi:hypothetical protein
MNFLNGLKNGSWDDMHDPHDEGRALLHASHAVHQVIDDQEFLLDHDDEDDYPMKSKPEASTSDTTVPEDSFILAACFLLLSFGYMVPWTSLGSLITYFKYTYSANFYVKLYCCYYLPGLPVALLQYRYDLELDRRFGSKRTYLLRGAICYIVMIAIISNMVNIHERYALILVFALLGVCGWLCHGTATMLASMYPPYAIASLQTGFRCPEIFTLLAVASLSLGKHITRFNLTVFYGLTAVAVFIGLMAWTHIILNAKSAKYFDAKDAQLSAINQNYNASSNSRMRNYNSHDATNLSKGSIDGDSRSVDKSRERISPPYEGIRIEPSTSSSSSSQEDQPSQSNAVAYIESSAYHDSQPLRRAKRLLNSMEDINKKAQVLDQVSPLSIALFFVIFASIFQASFFAYVDSTGTLQIEQVLYFVRLFADLFGRPLTRLPRPWFVKVCQVVDVMACSSIIYC